VMGPVVEHIMHMCYLWIMALHDCHFKGVAMKPQTAELTIMP
jgi:hypothetical protein